MAWLGFKGRRDRSSTSDADKMEASAEATRKVRGVLAERIVDLDRERLYLEELMAKMISERTSGHV